MARKGGGLCRCLRFETGLLQQWAARAASHRHGARFSRFKEMDMSADKHYSYDFKGVRLDPYRILDVYGITHPAQQHAIKKLLRAGRSVKTTRQDVEEVIMTLERWIQMMGEES